jgi:hypothetical protein
MMMMTAPPIGSLALICLVMKKDSLGKKLGMLAIGLFVGGILLVMFAVIAPWLLMSTGQCLTDPGYIIN